MSPPALVRVGSLWLVAAGAAAAAGDPGPRWRRARRARCSSLQARRASCGWPLEGLLIGQHGWTYALARGTFGPRAAASRQWAGARSRTRVACLMLLAYGLARLGACKGDVFVVGSLLLVVGLIALFVFYPVLCILLVRSARQRRRASQPSLFLSKLFSQSIWSLGCLAGARSCGVAWNTVAEAALVGAADDAARPRLRAGRASARGCR